jgi:16S rRNA C967 or C1407 C5-methylase (RsmB/RsmF family)/NOL1/NOP2/fmu family ribosome biogenesis protein
MGRGGEGRPAGYRYNEGVSENRFLPEAFAGRVREALGAEYPAFLAALSDAPPVSIRRNRRKPGAAFPNAEPIPWCPSGAYLPERPTFILDPLWHGGAYYVQEASSMLLYAALRRFATEPRPRRVLDLCAAPGGKTTLLADFLEDDALLIANEVIRSRVRILQENVTRWGWPNIVITNHDPAEFAPLAGFFDLVVVDAPCSGEGLFRKDPNAVGEWSEENAAHCAARQRRILETALPLVRPGGLLFYSTCTFNPDENDGAIADALADGGWEVLPFPAKPEWGMTTTEHGVACWPHRVRGEGFYLAVLRRAGNTLPSANAGVKSPAPLPAALSELAARWLAAPERFTLLAGTEPATIAVLPAVIAADAEMVRTVLPRSRPALMVGTMKGRELVPTHELALSVACSPELPAVELSRADALRYLKKETPELPPETAAGWNRMQYGGAALGWAKVIPGRMNNHLPTDWRIRQEIPKSLLAAPE